MTAYDRIDVFFVGAGNKQLATGYVTLELADQSAASHPLLDNLTAASQQKGSNFQSMAEAIQKFLTAFPGGFEGSRFHTEERDYKQAAHLASFEKIKFNDALKQPQNQNVFAMALADMLYGLDEEQLRFKRFAQVLEQIGLAKWPIATYFGFVRFPNERIFIKPEVTQKAAELCCWEINYQTDLNWRTYNGVLSLFQQISKELEKAGLDPKDMIDVQSFIWCSAQ